MPVPALRPDGGRQLISFEMLPLINIKNNPKNARRHSRKQLAALGRGMRKFGCVVPVVVDENNQLLCGHARVAAAREIGMEVIPAIRAEHLNETQKRAFSLADNRIAELASWDKRALQRELQFLGDLDIQFDFSAIGFDAAEVEVILDYDFDHDLKPNGEGRGRAKSSRRPADPPPVSKFGDMWCLGSHLIYCGRSDPRQVDAIVRRWQTDTGGTVVDLHSDTSFCERERIWTHGRKGDHHDQ